MGYVCHACARKGMHTSVTTDDRFIAKDGRVLCNSCAEGVEPCTTKKRLILDINANLNNCYYLLHTFNILLKSKVIECTIKDEIIEITLENGTITLNEDIEITKVRRPSNIIDKFTWCYMLKENGELLGYICKK